MRIIKSLFKSIKLLLLVVLLIVVQCVSAQATEIDSIWFPISKSELQQQILSAVASKDEERLYLVLMRARYSHLSGDACSVFDKLVLKDKDNPIVLAGCPLAHAFQNQAFGGPDYERQLE